MIFVMVGTHEQAFNRLIVFVDNLKKQNIIKEDVIIQTGFCTYEPQFCKCSKLLPYDEIVNLVAEAHIVITHGGPSSFIMPLQIGKIPIVVPRKKQFDEHVNNHQVEFSKVVSERQGNIIVVEEMDKLENIILHYDDIVGEMTSGINSNNAKFNEQFDKIVHDLFK